jgi:CRISPR/Cas system-associated endoribonuclease Cas2
LKDYRVKNRSLPVERRSDEHAVQDGRSLEPQIRDRFQRSVYEGELPGNRLEPSSAVWELITSRELSPVTFDRFNKLDRRASLERTQTSSERDAAVLSEDSLRGLNLRTDLSLAKIFAVTTLQRYGKK